METHHVSGDALAVFKTDFCRFCHLLYKRHLVSGVGGNMAARCGEHVLLTPSGYSLRDVIPEKVVVLDVQGKPGEEGHPTKDMGFHLGVLQARREINVVCHTHGAHIVASSAMLEPGPSTLPPLTPGFAYYAYPLPMIPFMVPGTVELTVAVVKALSPPHSRALLLQNHGLVTVGGDFMEAINIAEEIDEAARIFVLTNGEAKTIPPGDLDKIRP
jgi:ribulose-5-phosphate 4-epimerase/fuculose-1-phosphate aldolase